MQLLAGVPHVSSQTPCGRAPSGPTAASPSDRGRVSLASKSQVQSTCGLVGWHAETIHATVDGTSHAARSGEGHERRAAAEAACTARMG